MNSLQCLPASAPLVEANSAIPSHLHPVALRSTTSTSSPRIAAASKLAEAQLRATSLASLPPPSSSHKPPEHLPLDDQEGSDTSSEAHGSTPSSSSSSLSLQSKPGFLARHVAGLSIENHHEDYNPPKHPGLTAGLQVDPHRYPLLSSIRTPQASRPSSTLECTQSIRLITCAEFVELHDAYIASVSQVDESVVFPWLHCCGVQGTAQASYFSESPHARSPPRYRGLTIVSADSDLGPRSSARLNTSSAPGSTTQPSFQSNIRDRTRTRSLGASSTHSSTSLESALTASTSSGYTGTDSLATAPTSPSTSVVSFDGPEPRASLLRSSLLPQDILERCPHSGQYLSSFASPRLPPTVNLRLFRQQPSRYATISDVVVYSDAGLSDDAIALAQVIRLAQDRCFYERGAQAAGAVAYNVYIVTEPFEVFERDFSHVVAVDGWGYRRNKIDFFEREREEMAALTKASEISDNVWLGNSADVPLSQEEPSSSDKYAPFEDRPTSVNSHLVKCDERGQPAFDVCIEAHDQAMITPSLQFHLNQSYLDRIHHRAALAANCGLTEIVHMEVPSTGQSCSGTSTRDKLVRYLIDLCTWVKKMAKPHESQNRPPKKVLVHCHDGYTETSMFALSYVMYDRECTLPEAYLHLQNVKNRSFFVYPADVQLLRRVESRIEQELQEQRKAHMHCLSLDEPHRNSFLRGCVPFGISPVQNSKSTPTPPVSSSALSNSRSARSQHAWFYDSRFDGHFPSRILPFVYLGNLNHASNALMLKALGITHVVSMGESALVPPQNSRFNSPFGITNQSNVLNSLWHEFASGKIDVLDMKGVADDGIDSIRPHIERAMAFIDKCRLSGGKVLVHCRVGVSRSATIVIGYVMKHLKMDLASAYLMVRSRRLNILIQPNLLFMWGLKRLESDLVAQDDSETEQAECGGNFECAVNRGGARKRSIMSWSYLSREIADLNHRYLC